MRIRLNKMDKRILAASLKVCPILFYLIKLPYWYMLRIIINYWGKKGLHSITIGEFASGTEKTRSSYREEMLLKTILLYINMKNKSCLDLACNDGFWSFRLAHFGLKSVTGIDASKKSISKANFLKYIYDFPSFRFKQQDIFDLLNDSEQQPYDIILLLSIIYHLPEETAWDWFFANLSKMNSDCLMIDSRWFEDDEYWYDRNSRQAVIKTPGGLIRKWRPVREEVIAYLYESGYKHVIEINPSAFLQNPEEAYGNGDPYTLENVSDYITGHRTLVIAYKEKKAIPNMLNSLTVTHAKQYN